MLSALLAPLLDPLWLADLVVPMFALVAAVVYLRAYHVMTLDRRKPSAMLARGVLGVLVLAIVEVGLVGVRLVAWYLEAGAQWSGWLVFLMRVWAGFSVVALGVGVSRQHSRCPTVDATATLATAPPAPGAKA